MPQVATFRDYSRFLAELRDGGVPDDALNRVATFTDEVSARAAVAAAALSRTPEDIQTAFVAFQLAVPVTDVLYDYAARYLGRMIEREPTASVPPNGLRGRLYAWYWGLWGRALVYIYEATRESRFLDLLIETYERMLALRDDSLGLADEVRGRVVNGWASQIENGVRANEVTAIGLNLLPICEFLRLLREAPELDGYRTYYQRYLDSVTSGLDELLDEMVIDRSRDFGYYIVPGELDQVEALNHMAVYGAALTYAYRLTEREDYREAARLLSRFFREAITEHEGGGWSWPYAPNPADMIGRRGEEIWKAGVTVELPLAAFRCGFDFDRSDVDHLVATQLNLAMRPGPALNQWIWPAQTSILPELQNAGDRELNLNLPGIMATWLAFGAVRPDATEAFLALMAKNPNLFPGGWLDGARHMLFGLGWLLRTRAGMPLEFLSPDAPATVVPQSWGLTFGSQLQRLSR